MMTTMIIEERWEIALLDRMGRILARALECHTEAEAERGALMCNLLKSDGAPQWVPVRTAG